MKTMKKVIFVSCAVFAFAAGFMLLFASCAKKKDAGAGENRVINIGYDGGLCQGVVAIAHEKGFFKDDGLETRLVRSDNPRDAMVGGKIDTSTGMIAVWLKPISNGVDIVFTVGLHTGCVAAVVLADSGITKLAELKGKTIAITAGIGGQYQNIAFRFLAHDGLNPADYKWLDFAPDQGLVALQRGDAQAFVGPDQIIEKWVQEGSVRRIRSLNTDPDFKDEACCALGISGQFLRDNPAVAEKITRAVYRASLWLEESEEHKRETAQILLDRGYISGTVDYAVTLLNIYRYGLSPELTKKSLYDAVHEYQEVGLLSPDINADALADQIWHPFDMTGVTAEKDAAGAGDDHP
jgi:NitT/TauT family transport system substrate-binding protein